MCVFLLLRHNNEWMLFTRPCTVCTAGYVAESVTYGYCDDRSHRALPATNDITTVHSGSAWHMCLNNLSKVGKRQHDDDWVEPATESRVSTPRQPWLPYRHATRVQRCKLLEMRKNPNPIGSNRTRTEPNRSRTQKLNTINIPNRIDPFSIKNRIRREE